MKRMLVILAMVLMLTACGDADLAYPVRDVAVHRCWDWGDHGYIEASLVTDVLCDVVELADTVVIARADALTETTCDAGYTFRFTHLLTVERVLFDRDGRLHAGDAFTMRGLSGAAQIGEIMEVLHAPYSWELRQIVQRQESAGYADDEYYIASDLGAIPVETGHSYLLFLEYDAEAAVYLPAGYEFQCEYIDGRLVSGNGVTKRHPAFDFADILAAVDARTGRADEIGAEAYREEAYARKQAELAAARTALRQRMELAAAARTGEVVPMSKRNIVHTVENALFAGDSLSERLEACEAVVIGTMDAMTLEEGLDALRIGYEIAVETVLYAREDCVEAGDAVSVQGFCGLFPAWEMQELVGFSEGNIRGGILQEGYRDGDLVSVTNCGGIPAEVGKTYLILLGKSAIVREYDYFDCGGAYFYEYADGKLYTGDGRRNRRADVQLADVQKVIDALG